MALRILRSAHLRGRPPGLAGGMSGARISHSWSERSLGYRHRDENIKGLQKPAMLLIKPHYLPSRTASSTGSPSQVTIVGLMLLLGRLPPSGELARFGTGSKSVSSLLRMNPWFGTVIAL